MPDPKISAMRFINTPMDGITSYVTLGLSAWAFVQRGSGRRIRQELVATCLPEFDSNEVAAMLLATAAILVDRAIPLQRDELVWPLPPFLEHVGGKFVGFLSSSPGYFDDRFALLDADLPILFVEIYPLTERECRFAECEGVEALLDAIEQGQVDVLDFSRAWS
jgi:hypothetical protein